MKRMSAVLVLVVALSPFAGRVLHAAHAVAPSGLPRAAAADVGMDARALERIGPAMEGFVARGEAAGIVTLVARRGRIVYCEAVGLADREAQRAMTTDTLFNIASMTKPVTATALMILVDEGKVAIDDPVAEYLPQLKRLRLEGKPPAEPITFVDLLTHTSGIVGGQETLATLAATVDGIAARPLAFSRGSRWQYSPGLNVCGRAIEVISGMSYAEFVAKRILEPLGMSDSTFRPTAEQESRRARLYQPAAAGKGLEPAAHWLMETGESRAPNPSGGLISTAADMARFYQMILNGGELHGRRIVSARAVRQMTSVRTGELETGFTPGCAFGLGWCIARQPQGVTAMLSPGTFGHGGAFGTQGWIDRKREMIFVLMVQRTGFGNSDGSTLRETFQQLAVAAIRD